MAKPKVEVIMPLPDRREELPGGITVYPVVSSEKEYYDYEPSIDIETGHGHCQCKSFIITLEPEALSFGITPNIHCSDEYFCKHLRWLLRNLVREGLDVDSVEVDIQSWMP